MEWLNLHASTLDSDEFLGSEPVERATWICLLRYCIGQENGGRIAGAADWSDRKWQQIARVTLKEVKASCPLWSMDGSDLVVWSYPVDRENIVRKNRQDGKAGGRPKGSGKRRGNPPVSGAGSDPFDSAETEGEGEREEEEEREGEARTGAYPSPSENAPKWKERKLRAARQDLQDARGELERGKRRIAAGSLDREELPRLEKAVREAEKSILKLGEEP